MPSPLALPFALVNLLVIAGALVASRRELSAYLPNTVSGRRALLTVLFLGLVLRAVNPYHHLLWLDEWYPVGQAEGLVHHRLNAFCVRGRMGDCQQFATFDGIGYPLVLGLTSSILGFTELAARTVGVLGGTLTIALVYLLVRILFRDHQSALWAALILALLPMHLRYGATTRLVVLSVLTECLTVLGAALHVRTGRSSAAWLTAASLAFHMTVRKENPLVLVPLMMVYWWGRRKGVRYSPVPWIVALVLLTPYVAGWFEMSMGYNDVTDRLGTSSLARNLDYVLYWFNGYFTPFLFTALAALGMVALAGRSSTLTLLVTFWWSARLVVFLLHDFMFFVPRYMIGLSVPFAIACGLGARTLTCSQRSIATAILLSGLAYLPFAYGDMFGLQLDAGARAILYAIHLLLPVAFLLWAAGRAGGRERRLLAALATIGAILIVLLYPRVAVGDGIPPDVRDYLALEERTVARWRNGVEPSCHVVASVPVRAEHLWGRRMVHVESFFLLPTTGEELVRVVIALVDRGECVYLYDSQGTANARDALAGSSLSLERIDTVPISLKWVEAFGASTELALYRVGPAGE